METQKGSDKDYSPFKMGEGTHWDNIRVVWGFRV